MNEDRAGGVPIHETQTEDFFEMTFKANIVVSEQCRPDIRNVAGD